MPLTLFYSVLFVRPNMGAERSDLDTRVHLTGADCDPVAGFGTPEPGRALPDRLGTGQINANANHKARQT